MKTIFLSLWLFTISFLISAQQTQSEAEMLHTFDNTIGIENTKLYNGKRYFSVYKYTEDNHNFHKTAYPIKGEVTYDNASFYNVNLKYDILDDNLIFEPNGHRSYINIELVKDKVSGFKINNQTFINSQLITENNKQVTGYLEVVYESATITMYAKRKKTATKKIKKNRVYHLYSNKPDYYISYNGAFNEIKSTNSFKKLFLNHEEDLKKIIKKNKERFRKDEEGFYLFLAEWMDFKLKNNSTN
ncbi:hypothetical protein [uncultured Lacinutrix sp.]|uniref:hypothetical protein n=1 Tax=uncultured Lacinutrix sp. TaxID=574032 RepID=UPI00260BC1F6|nr:hypothetical protein [uncultured Lacinutrix sp.]